MNKNYAYNISTKSSSIQIIIIWIFTQTYKRDYFNYNIWLLFFTSFKELKCINNVLYKVFLSNLYSVSHLNKILSLGIRFKIKICHWLLGDYNSCLWNEIFIKKDYMIHRKKPQDFFAAALIFDNFSTNYKPFVTSHKNKPDRLFKNNRD